MDIAEINQAAGAFNARLEQVKEAARQAGMPWYPYHTLGNFSHLERLLSGDRRRLLELIGEGPVLDIGGADGDTAFFMESLGIPAHVIDWPPTNYNGCRGIKLMRLLLDSRVELHETDLDGDPRLPEGRFRFAFFLGILYHLKNPFRACEWLAQHADYAVISTRVTRYNVAHGAEGERGVNPARVAIADLPVAYLVDADECNRDATNYWMFSVSGLKRMLHRAGWDVLDFMTTGDTRESDPASLEHDERAFALLRSRY